jgi:hypothetical protein
MCCQLLHQLLLMALHCRSALLLLLQLVLLAATAAAVVL